MSHAHYLRFVVNPELRKSAVQRTLRAIRKERFDTIAVRGVSGLTVGAIIAHRRKVGLAVIRKASDLTTHSPHDIETPLNVSRYIIVDDNVSSGQTIYTIVQAMTRRHPESKCIGVARYNSREDLFWNSVMTENSIKNFVRTYPELTVATIKNVR